MTVLVQNSYLLPHKLVPYALILTKFFILATGQYHAICDCYTAVCLCKQTVHFSRKPMPLGMVISSVNHLLVRVS